MADVITFATTKGGTGKTTLTAGLASYWHQKGKKVAVVDADPNTNLSRWFSKGAITDIVVRSEANENVIIDVIDSLAQEYDLVLVDVAGFGNQAMVYAIGVSSLVIIPSRPAEDDVLEALRTKQVVQNAAKLSRHDIPYQVVLTQVKHGTLVLEHSREQFRAFNVPVFKTEIVFRTAFQNTRFQGTTPIQTDPSGKAAKELEALGKEIKRQLSVYKEKQVA